MRAGQKEGAKRSRAHLPPEHGSPSSCVRQKICFERVTAFSLPLLLKKEERAGERRRFLSIPLSPALSPLVPCEEREAEHRRRFACRTQLVAKLSKAAAH